ncbi:hypothetical protein [Acidaminobacterium chupaoyuni]
MIFDNSPAMQDLGPNPSPDEPMEHVILPRSLEDVELASLQETLADNLGYYVIIEFLIGTNGLIAKDGILYAVGINYVTLYQEEFDRYVTCDMYSIKFVNFYNAKTKPRNIVFPSSVAQPPAGSAPNVPPMRPRTR